MKHPFFLIPWLLLAGALALPCHAGGDPVPYPAVESAEADQGQPPKVLTRVEPLMPAALAGQAIDEEVHIAFVVDSTGRPVKVRAFFSRHAELEAPAVEAVKQWTFTPGIHQNRAVSTQMVVALRFASPAPAKP